MRMYRRDHVLDRDQVEDAQLAQKEAQEGMPKNVQDFKDHPYYALERHLRRSEVIHPKREVGKIAAGKSTGDKTLEPIYRRRDVHELKSADKWYRMGREIKTGEQPLKRVAARRTQKSVFDDDQMSEDEDSAGTGLYAVFQTTIYNAPPVVNGRIPKNIYGNLDIYVPSMVPAGGVHITHPETARAAKILSIDYADAVTGFAFKGRHGTAIVNGAVVATQYCEAVEEVIKAFEDERTEAEEARRSADALRMWRRLLAGLRIRERIEGYEVEGERDAKRERMEDEDEEAGGFVPDRDAEGVAEPTASRMFVDDLASPEENIWGGLLAGDEDQSGGFVAENDDRSGGFVSKNQDSGGGFMPEDQAENPYIGARKNHQPLKYSSTNTIEGDDNGGYYPPDIDEDAEEAMRETESANPHEPQEPKKDIWEEGGGFMLCEEQGERFLPNDSENNTIQTHPEPGLEPQQPVPQLPSRKKEPPSTAPIDLGLADEDLAEARMLQESYESSQVNRPPAAPVPSSANIPSDDDQPDSLDIAHDATPSEAGDGGNSPPPTQEEMEEKMEPQSPASDPGSLLSHDPDDDDADPEWLA